MLQFTQSKADEAGRKSIQGFLNGEPFVIPVANGEHWDALTDFQEAFTEAFEIQEKARRKEVLAEIREDFEAFMERALNGKDTPMESDIEGMAMDAQGRYYLSYKDTVSSVAIPEVFIRKMKEAKEKGLSDRPIYKLLIRSLRNQPRVIDAGQEGAENFLNRLGNYAFSMFYSKALFKKLTDKGFSEEVARERSLVYQTPITQEGLLNCKKVASLVDWQYEQDEEGNTVRTSKYKTISVDPISGLPTDVEDEEFAEGYTFLPYIMGMNGDAFRCVGAGGNDGSLGHIMRVGALAQHTGWDKVNCNDHASCVKGLHVGNQDYINGLESERSVTLNCFVCPSQIGAIPHDDVRGVMRVKEYFIHSMKDREDDNRQLYHSSDYAAQLDEAWEADRKEVVERFRMEQEELEKKIAELQAL